MHVLRNRDDIMPPISKKELMTFLEENIKDDERISFDIRFSRDYSNLFCSAQAIPVAKVMNDSTRIDLKINWLIPLKNDIKK